VALESRRPSSRIVAEGMLRENTPLEDWTAEWGLWVKREDRACPPPGPPFSKARGVYAWCAARRETLIGVLDTRHSQAGWAVARACQVLGKRCLNFYPEFKHEPGPREPQRRAEALGAELVGLPAGRSAILYHEAKKRTEARGGVTIPNALKLEESVTETAREVPARPFDAVLIPVSSGTIAAGVIKGFVGAGRPRLPLFVLHLGYSRSHEQVRKYVREASGVPDAPLELVDEGYEYKDSARPGPTPPWPCSAWYDLKAVRWLCANRGRFPGETLFWNIG
jgi:hypothetical protein